MSCEIIQPRCLVLRHNSNVIDEVETKGYVILVVKQGWRSICQTSIFDNLVAFPHSFGTEMLRIAKWDLTKIGKERVSTCFSRTISAEKDCCVYEKWAVSYRSRSQAFFTLFVSCYVHVGEIVFFPSKWENLTTLRTAYGILYDLLIQLSYYNCTESLLIACFVYMDRLC